MIIYMSKGEIKYFVGTAYSVLFPLDMNYNYYKATNECPHH